MIQIAKIGGRLFRLERIHNDIANHMGEASHTLSQFLRLANWLSTMLKETRKQFAHLLVIWDGATIHHCRVVKGFLTQGGAKRIHLERFPGYAPELNPQEGVWNLLKRRELKNLCARDL
jgi:hypothetical protein